MEDAVSGRLGKSVTLDGVRFAFPGASFSFDLSVPASSVVVVIGPSGAGKSTLLDLIAGFKMPTSGRILIGDDDVSGLPPAARPVSVVFQENNLFAHLDVAANVGLGRRPDLHLTEEDRALVAAAVERVGLAGKEKRKPASLSGGERQRVAVARALVRRRPVLLLDESFGSLGPALRDSMLGLVSDLHRETGMTIIMVSHNPDDAIRLSAHLVFVEGGRVAEEGPADKLLSPDGPAVLRAYLGVGSGGPSREG